MLHQPFNMEPGREQTVISQLKPSNTQQNLDESSFKDDTTLNSKTQNTTFDMRAANDNNTSIPLSFTDLKMESTEVDLKALKDIDGYRE